MKISHIIMSGLLMVSFFMAYSASAGQGRQDRKSGDQSVETSASTAAGEVLAEGKARVGTRHDNPMGMLGRFQFENTAAETISELASQPVETVALKFQDSSLPEVLKAYNITMEAFRAAMKPKFITLIHKRVEDGSITSAQETLILEALERQDSREETMTKLIQNGVTDGIITRDEADTMLTRGDEEPPSD